MPLWLVSMFFKPAAQNSECLEFTKRPAERMRYMPCASRKFDLHPFDIRNTQDADIGEFLAAQAVAAINVELVPGSCPTRRRGPREPSAVT